MNVKCSDTHKLNDINGISLALCKINTKNRHIGILYNDRAKNTKFLHHASYRELRKDDPCAEYIWMDVSIDNITKITLSTWCEEIVKSNPNGIPYDINMEKTGFDKDGVFFQSIQHTGLTCATFVIQVFASHGINLIDYTKWPIRDEDKKWQAMIVQYFVDKIPFLSRNNYLSQKAREILVGIQRFKPEEVAAAASLPFLFNGEGQVLGYSQEGVKSLAKDVVSILNKHQLNCPRN